MKQSASLLKKNILFVCLGNICRSPIAEGVFRQHAKQRGLSDHFFIESAGLGSWHIGSPPDERAQAAMRLRGMDISDLRARRVVPADFEFFDLILAMDRSNRENLYKLAPFAERHKIALFMDFAPNMSVQEIPDPFFGNANSFDYACQLIDTACRGLLVSLTTRQSAHMASTARSAESSSFSG